MATATLKPYDSTRGMGEHVMQLVKRKVKEPSEEQLAKGVTHAKRGKRIDPHVAAEMASEERGTALRAEFYSDEIDEAATRMANSKRLVAHGDELPPALTAATVPAGIAARAASGNANRNGQHPPENRKPKTENGAPRPVFSDRIVRLPLKSLVRHPDNRQPAKADIAERAASMGAKSQLEPILVRMLDGAGATGGYQVLSGETRWLAAELLGWSDIKARVRDCDGTEALELLAIANAQRKDLTPIEKARLIARLCQPKDQQGGGLTREAAGRIYGVEAATASNLVRLLELPQAWQDRVSSGELAWTWARELLPIVKLPPALARAEKEWAVRDEEMSKGWRNAFESRHALVEAIESWIEEECPRIDESHWVEGGGQVKLNVEKLPADVRDRLGIVEIQIPTGKRGQMQTVPVSTNGELFDELLKGAAAKKGKASAEKVGRDDAAPTRELTAAERRQKTADRAKQLAGKIALWRHKLLRRECVRMIDEGRDDGVRLAMCYAAEVNPIGPRFCELLQRATKHKPAYADARSHHWPCVGELTTPTQQYGVLREIAKAILLDETDNWRGPPLCLDLVNRYAAELSIDVAGSWLWLQAKEGDDLPARRQLLEEFFLLHQTEELRALAGELGVHLLPTVKTRADIVKVLLSIPQGTRRLPLPASIKPLAGVKAAKTTKSTKSAKGK